MLSIIFGFHNLFTCLGVLISGPLRRKLSARTMMVIFMLLSGIGLIGFPVLPESSPGLAFALAFIFFCVFAATGIGSGINTVQSTTIPWFPEHSGVISGACCMALGVSYFILAAIAQAVLKVLSVKFVLPISGGIIIIVTLIILMDRRSTTPPASEEPMEEPVGATVKEMAKSPAFIILLIRNICMRICGLILLGHAASMAAFFGGLAIVAMMIPLQTALEAWPRGPQWTKQA